MQDIVVRVFFGSLIAGLPFMVATVPATWYYARRQGKDWTMANLVRNAYVVAVGIAVVGFLITQPWNA